MNIEATLWAFLIIHGIVAVALVVIAYCLYRVWTENE